MCGTLQVRYSRRNLFTAIYLIDPSKKEQLAAQAVVSRFIAQSAPTRVGFVLVCPETLKQVQRLRVADDVDILSSGVCGLWVPLWVCQGQRCLVQGLQQQQQREGMEDPCCSWAFAGVSKWSQGPSHRAREPELVLD